VQRLIIGTLQVLRALAAVSVVYYHGGYAATGTHTDLGGVTMFFVISGFISCHIAANDPGGGGGKFLVRRIKRIAPLYWLSTFALLLLVGRLWDVPVDHIVLSLLFVPHDGAFGAFPVLGVGWTLNIEMACYALFALALRLAPSQAPLLAAGLILAARAGVTQFAPTGSSAAIHAGALYAEAFVAGIFVWLIWNANRARLEVWAAPRWLFPAAVFIYVVTMLTWAFVAHDWPDLQFRASVLVLATALTAIAVVAARCGADVQAPWLMTLGGASYALYLTHTIVQSLGARHGFVVAGPVSAAIYIAICIAIALAIHRWVEPPIARMLAPG